MKSTVLCLIILLMSSLNEGRKKSLKSEVRSSNDKYQIDDNSLESSIETPQKPCAKKPTFLNLFGSLGYFIPEFLIGGYYLISGILCVASASGCAGSTVTVLMTSSTTLLGSITTVEFSTSTSSTSTSISSTTVTFSFTTTSTTSFSTSFVTFTSVTTTTSKGVGRKRRSIELQDDDWSAIMQEPVSGFMEGTGDPELIDSSPVESNMFTASPGNPFE